MPSPSQATRNLFEEKNKQQDARAKSKKGAVESSKNQEPKKETQTAYKNRKARKLAKRVRAPLFPGNLQLSVLNSQPKS